MKTELLVYVLYALGSCCFLAGSLLTIWLKVRGHQ
jgi:hypothetical protein